MSRQPIPADLTSLLCTALVQKLGGDITLEETEIRELLGKGCQLWVEVQHKKLRAWIEERSSGSANELNLFSKN